MDANTRYQSEAPPPTEATLHEAVRYMFDEIMRRAWVGTRGLTAADLDVDPGHGAMTIGQLLEHEIFLIRFFTEGVEPGSTSDISIQLGGPGAWNIDAILATRERLAERFREVWARATLPQLMEKRPDMPPPQWAEWPALMRMSRPLVDLATHVGQVNYARRQLGKPLNP